MASSTSYGSSSSNKDELDLLEEAISESVRDGQNVKFHITPKELSFLSEERTRTALAETLEAALLQEENKEETPLLEDVDTNVRKVTQQLKQQEKESSSEKEDKVAQVAANALASVVLYSSPEYGIASNTIEQRKKTFGSNAIADKPLDSFCKLCFEASQDFVLIMLIVLGILSIVVETTYEPDCNTCWIEGAAILCSVCIVVLVTASIDYAKQFAFIRLAKNLHETNTKLVIRNGEQEEIVDDEVVVGDVLLVNSHNRASIPADCVVLQSNSLTINESSLTGESKLISKRPGDVVLSGTIAEEGSAKLVVICVGIHSVAGKIQAQVYESEDHVDTLGSTDEDSPLYVKLDSLAKNIGMAGTVAAVLSFIVCCFVGLLIRKENPERIVYYLMVSITVLAVAVPEGLPLAVTLALAFSSNQMMKEQNLVKHLDACETMGCATTICTDKTGTLTANKMTTRALYAGGTNKIVEDPSVNLSDYVKSKDGGVSSEILDLIAKLISICTMDESSLFYDDDGKVERSSGNPTEVALLQFTHDLGFDYQTIRQETKGRADTGQLAEYLDEGKQYGFSSARKMMSWAVPREDGGYRLYSKGAQEVIAARCTTILDSRAKPREFTKEKREEWSNTALSFSRRGMRCLGLAYRDLPKKFDLESLTSSAKNSDGSEAYKAETELVAVGLVGIEDPLRPEVPDAITKCYTAGIDVRLVTGDNPNTAVSIAFQAGILKPFHFKDPNGEMVASNLKKNVMMEGKKFRGKVYRLDDDKERHFNQDAFDKIWPRLRVLARSSPDDKLTLAHGLNQSNLYADKKKCNRLLKQDDIKIFPDRQVVAMTGDGTNDAPALKRADIGFAMGLAGTQIAKDAADIILLDDNFASIVTAAKYGRNIYASIQKFLQFQLTVNFSAVATALTGSFVYQTSPLAAIQLLWVNLLMDSLASLALASEPPVPELLLVPPVNRSDALITRRMWINILGQALYQIVVVFLLLFHGPKWFDITPGDVVEEEDFSQGSVHYTIIFNTFVWMQLFNEINCRKLNGEFRVFKGLFRNPLFCGILLVTSILQVVIVQYGSVAFHVVPLSLYYWGICLAFGASSLVVQQIINLFIIETDTRYKSWRMPNRRKKYYSLSKRSINGLLERDYDVPIDDDDDDTR